MITFDHILSNRIGFGQFQWKTFLIVGLIDFLDGSEAQFLTVLNLIIYQEWKLSTGNLVVIGIVFHLGLLLGNLISALYADRFGRKNLLKISTVVQFITIMLTTVVQNYNQFIVIRFLYGFELGVINPLSHLLITECTPMEIRGKFLVALSLLFVLGRNWMVIVEMIFLDNLSEGNWRAIALINGIPAFLCMLGSYLYIEESARFLIISGHFEEGRRVIDKMGQENKGDDFELTDDEFNQIKEWQVQNFQRSIQQRSIYGLFNEINFKFTWRIWIFYLFCSLVIEGIQLIVPFLFADEQKTLFDLLLVSLSEVPVFLVVFALIDNKQIGGRKRLTLFGCLFESVALLIIWYFQGNFLLTGLIIFQISIRVKGLGFNPMITESYNTVYRSLGIGSALCVYRISGAFVPALVFPLYEKDKYKFFFLSLIATFIMLVIIVSYPIDLTKKPLDEIYSDIIEDIQFNPNELQQDEREQFIDINKQKLNKD